jgi:protein MpaA
LFLLRGTIVYPIPHLMQRLGKNTGAYYGETIDLVAVLEDCLAAAPALGWTVEPIPAPPALALHALRRPARAAGTSGPRRIYVSTGIHGDEPAGPLAVRRMLHEDRWPADAELWLCPCLNPTGFPLNRRENSGGVDLNRDYLHLESPEIRAHTAWLDRQPDFDFALCLHEDWEAHGFYLYELNPDARPTLADKMIAAAAAVCPIDLSSVIEAREASQGIIRPSHDPASRAQWPEAFFLLQHRTRMCYTLEAPSDFPMSTRVDALVTATYAAMGV